MNSVKHFFRRYIFSTVGIIALFFMINILLLETAPSSLQSPE